MAAEIARTVAAEIAGAVEIAVDAEGVRAEAVVEAADVADAAVVDIAAAATVATVVVAAGTRVARHRLARIHTDKAFEEGLR